MIISWELFEIIYKYIKKIKCSQIHKEINAFSFLTSYPNGKPINRFNETIKTDKGFLDNIIFLDYLSARYMNCITGDY